MPPITRAIGNSAGSKCHCVKYYGTYTASAPGAITRKIADPMIAGARRMTFSLANADVAGQFSVAVRGEVWLRVCARGDHAVPPFRRVGCG